MKPEVCQTALTALEKAMEVERQGEAFYKEIAAHMQDPSGKAVFETLAKDEVEHVRILQAEYENIQKQGEWMKLSAAQVCVPSAPLKLFPAKRDAALAVPANAKDVDALNLAMEFEEKGYHAYVKLGAETSDLEGKKVFNFLAKQESSHYLFLRKTHEYLTTQGTWYFDDQEFPMFDGG